ncbi:MAG: FG-GAP-like repeat-containing protein [Ignavibacteriaceae bacterium]
MGDEENLYFALTIQDAHSKEWIETFNLKKPNTPNSTSFTGHETSIDIRWTPNSDSDLKGYNVYRSSGLDGTYQKINNRLIEGTSYFNDMDLEKETIYYYKVSAVDEDANESGLTSAIETWTTIANLSGWPIKGNEGNFVFASSTLFDVDNDGAMEIFTADASGKIYAFDQQSTTVRELFDIDNNPTTISGFAYESNVEFWSSPAISDLDGDGIYELVIAGRYSNNTLYCWHINDANGDGRPDLYWTVDLGDACLGSPAIGDIDHTGHKEIVIISHNGEVHIVKDDGSFWGGSDPWKTTAGSTVEAYCTPALVDLDNDGDLEIIFGGKDGKMYVCHHNGSNYSANWPFNTSKNNLGSSPAVADIDGDGQYEIIFIAANGSGSDPVIYVKGENGEDKTGWSSGKSIEALGFVVPTSPAIGNLDDDDQLEIVVGTGNTVYAWNHDGSFLSTSWPKTGFAGTSSSPMIADIDDEAGPEIIIGSSDHNLYAWHKDGSNVKGWPLITGNMIEGSPAIGDIDGDGDNEVTIGSFDNYFYVWNTKGTTNKDWPMFHNDADNSGSYYQNYLLNNAVENKSITYSATCHNNNHIIERGYYGKLHLVFSSGGEIFYRRSSDNGSNWELTKRISSGNGSNEHPSIVAAQYNGSDILCLVWQYKINNTHYKVFYSFSSNSGSTWSTPTILPGCSDVTISFYQSNSYYGPGPTPVIASFIEASDDEPDFLLVYAANDGLHYRYAQNYYSSWSADAIIPGATSDHVWYPSLSTYNSRDYYSNYHQVNLIYDQRFNNIYSQIFKYPGLNWTNRVQISTSGSTTRFSTTMTIDNYYNTDAVWGELYGSYYSIRFRNGYPNGSWSSWNQQWIVSNAHCYNPSITYYNASGVQSLDILFFTSTQQIRQKKYHGIVEIPPEPSTQVIASSGMFTNLTHERFDTPVPIQIWTNQTQSPYSILYNSNYLPKESPRILYGEIRRAVEIVDTTNNSGLKIEFNQPIIKLSSGDSVIAPFKKYDYKAKLSLSLSNIFDYLQTESFTIPEDVESISCKAIVKSLQLDTLADGTVNADKKTNFKNISFNLFVKDMNSKDNLLDLASQNLNNDKGFHDFNKIYKTNVAKLNKKYVFIIPEVNISGKFKDEDLSLSLVNISVEDSSLVLINSKILSNNIIPNEYSILGNYPNPFNPSTTISYNLPRISKVEIEIFDILGKKIKSFSFSSQSAGRQGVLWNGTNSNNQQVASGIYLYHFKAVSLEGKNEIFEKTAKLLLLK